LVTDAFSRDSFARAMVTALQDARVLADHAGEIRFRPTDRLSAMTIDPEALVWRTGVQITQSSMLVDDKVMVTLVRRGRAGPHPGVELMRHLTERGFPATPPLLGDVVRVDADGHERILAVAQGFIRNQGNGWDWLLAQARRMFDDALVADPPLPIADLLAGPAAPAVGFLEALGRRLGEFHALLAEPCDDPLFAAHAVSEATLQAWRSEAQAAVTAVLERVHLQDQALEAAAPGRVDQLLARRRAFAARLRSLPRAGKAGLCVRGHGALRLHQTLVVSGDAAIVGFGLVVPREDGMAGAHISPARDLATLLADLDAVQAASVQELPPSRAGAEDPRPALASAWGKAARAALLGGYRTGAAGSPCLPTAPRDLARLIRLFAIAEAATALAQALDAHDTKAALAQIDALLRLVDEDDGA
jgi:maltose alpha-D-glucosyltransferase/alpha-amylase